MALLARYYLPGLAVEDRSVDVPLDWRGTSPARAASDGLGGDARLKLFYRVVCAPGSVGRELPLLVYLQRGPGGCAPRLCGPDSDGWLPEALRHFRVVLPDQRGTGRSSRLSRHGLARVGDARAQADHLKRFLARSIVCDLEYLRLVAFEGRRWVTLGQSYGGFLTLSYLSWFPEGVAASFVAGGIPHLPARASEVYARTFDRMAEKTRRLYERYPGDAARVAAVADLAAGGGWRLPDGSPLTVRRLQLLGAGLGMKPAFERLHNLFDTAFEDGDGSVGAQLTDGFLMEVLASTTTAANPLYWTLQELIYADGDLDEPIGWAAEREWRSRPEFSPGARPLMLTGEAAFPWMFEEDPLLAPLAPAMDALMADTHFDRVYDPARLATNEVPLQAVVYFDDLYVDADLSLDTLSRVGASHAWVTNEFEHDGLHGPTVFRRLLEEARARGDLEGVR